MLPRRDDARKKSAVLALLVLFIGPQVVFFLSCDLKMDNRRLSRNAPCVTG